jgi:putative hemolysin
LSINGTDLILVVAAVVVSALCSGLEIAFVSSNKLYIELERKRGAIWARLVSVMLKRPARVIGALLVGNNIALVLYGILMAQLLEPWLRGFGSGMCSCWWRKPPSAR